MRISIGISISRVQQREGDLARLYIRKQDLIMPASPHPQIPYSALSVSAKQEPLVGAVNNCGKYKRKIFSFAWPFVFLIYCYQVFIPDRFKRRCIYTPTCSRYAIVCLERDGLNKGLRLARARIARCNSALFHPGVDIP